MKKKNFLAVVAIMMALCVAFTFSSCKDNNYGEGLDVKEEPTDVKKLSCGVTQNTYQGTGVVTTRAAAVEQLDGTLTTVSRHKATFTNCLPADTVRTYEVRNTIEARGVLKPRYAKTLDSFKEQNLTMTETIFDNGQNGKFIKFKDGDNHNFYYSFIITPAFETDTFQIWNPSKKQFDVLQRCINEIVSLEFLSQRVTDLQRDSVGWHAYRVIHAYSGRLSEGPNNGFTYEVTIPLVWVWKGGGTPVFPPEENPDPLVVEDRDSGFDFVNDSTSQSWLSVVTRYTDGTVSKPDTIAVLVKNTIEEPAYQVKQVENFSWSELSLQPFDEVTDGSAYEKENKISVTPFVKAVKARTDKGDAIFKLKREGRPIFTDSLGGKHYLPEKQWLAKSQNWDDDDMSTLENFERKLLTCILTAQFNEHEHDATGKIELRKVKGADVELVGYEYENFDIRTITPNVLYFTFAEQYAVFSNDKKEKVGEIGTNIRISTVSPEKQEIEVADWNINDLSIQNFNATRQSSHRDTIETGVFTITPFAKKNTTQTNKSKHDFTTTYDGTVVFKDKFGKEVTFLALDPSFEDKGGVSTLTNLAEENDFERKAMTSTLAVTAYGSDVSNHIAEIIFKKKVEKEQLLSWSKTLSLTPAGNGMWTTSATITKVWKLAGTKTNTVSQDLDCSISGEPKSQIKLNEASAPYVSLNEGTWSAETSSTPQQYVTLYTKTNTTISENYTNLTDKYTAKMQRATYKEVVDGQTIEFDFLAPSEMTITHKDGSLVNGNRTATVDGVNYDVWDHTGSVTATVTSASNDSQTQDAIDEKEVLVAHIVVPEHPEWGAVDRLGGASLAYHKDIGDNMQGAFHKVMAIYFEKGILIVHTNSWGPSAYDFTYDENDFYYYGSTYRGVTLPQTVKVNSAILRDGRWEPALITQDGSGWTYVGLDGFTVNMSQNLAITANIKNFNSETTAANNPFLAYTGQRSGDLLNVYTNKGALVFSIK